MIPINAGRERTFWRASGSPQARALKDQSTTVFARRECELWGPLPDHAFRLPGKRERSEKRPDENPPKKSHARRCRRCLLFERSRGFLPLSPIKGGLDGLQTRGCAEQSAFADQNRGQSARRCGPVAGERAADRRGEG